MTPLNYSLLQIWAKLIERDKGVKYRWMEITSSGKTVQLLDSNKKVVASKRVRDITGNLDWIRLADRED